MLPTLYHVPRTISSPLVQVLVELEAVDKHVSVKEMSFKDLKSKEHLEINPMGTSPAFHDPELDLTMWESGAVLDYLLERYDTEHRFHPPPTDSNSTPEQVRRRSKYLQMKQYIIATVYPFIASLYIHSLKKEELRDPVYMEEAQKKCHTVLGPVMSKWLGDGPYFLGDEISAIDFLAAKPLTNVKALGLIDEFPSLKALFERVSERMSYMTAYEGMDKHSPGPNKQTIVLVPQKQDRPVEKDKNKNLVCC